MTLSLFPLEARVRYRPYHRDPAWPTAWHPYPWRVVGRGLLQMLGRADRPHYVIQPWVLSGTWMLDRPLVVDADQVEPWPEPVTPTLPVGIPARCRHCGEGLPGLWEAAEPLLGACDECATWQSALWTQRHPTSTEGTA